MRPQESSAPSWDHFETMDSKRMRENPDVKRCFAARSIYSVLLSQNWSTEEPHQNIQQSLRCENLQFVPKFDMFLAWTCFYLWERKKPPKFWILRHPVAWCIVVLLPAPNNRFRTTAETGWACAGVDECEYYQRQCFEFTWDSVLCLSMTCVWVNMLNCKKYQLKQIPVEAWWNSCWSVTSLLQRKHFLLHCCCLLLEGKEGFCRNKFYLFFPSQNVSKLFNFH